MMLEDGTVLENIAASNIQVTNASLADGDDSGRRGIKRQKPMKKEERTRRSKMLRNSGLWTENVQLR